MSTIGRGYPTYGDSTAKAVVVEDHFHQSKLDRAANVASIDIGSRKQRATGDREVMMLQARLLGALAITGLLLTNQVARADAIRCGDQLASNGASLYEVRAICGDPDMATQRVEQRIAYQRVVTPCVVENGKTVCESVIQRIVDIVIDDWTYDFGSNRFITFVRFENGSLVRVTEGPYGKKPPA